MSNRFARTPDPRNDLFSSYNRSASPSKSKATKPSRASPYGGAPGYGYTPPSSADGHLAANGSGGPAFAAYPGNSNGTTGVVGAGNPHFRAATPNPRGQYSSAVLDELESQNEEQVGVLTGKVAMLKQLTTAIGDEIRDSTSFAEKMNDQFENSRLKIRGTMNRMLRMAQKTGVGWRVWLGLFAAVCLLFWYVWLF